MAVKSVLILTAGFGEGHNAAARNLRNAIQRHHPDIRVDYADIFAEAYGWMNRLAQRNYLRLINHAPTLWNHVFQWLDRSTVVADRIGVFGKAAKLLEEKITTLQPDAVVTTYPGYNHLLDHIHTRRSSRSYAQITIITDSITVNSVWLTGHSDWLLVPNEQTADVVRAKGADPAKVRVAGFPVPEVFSTLQAPKVPPLPGDAWRLLFMVNSGKRTAVEVLHALHGLKNIRLTLTVGRDDVLQRRLERVAGDLGIDARFFGWTDQMPNLIAESHVVISKAGGATVQECLAAKSPMLISQVVPGQEEGNARLIESIGAGAIADSPEKIRASLERTLAGDAAEWRRWYTGACTLSRPEASVEIADWIAHLDRP